MLHFIIIVISTQFLFIDFHERIAPCRYPKTRPALAVAGKNSNGAAISRKRKASRIEYKSQSLQNTPT